MSIVTGFGNYTSRIWRFRYFWLSLVLQDLRTRYRRSALGIAWSLLHPIVMATVLSVVFHQLFQQDIHEYLPFVLSGIGIWNYFTTASLDGCNCLYLGEKYIRSHPLPLAIYPLRVVLGVSFHFLIVLGLTLVVTGICQGYGNVLALLTLIPSLVLVFCFGWAVATIFGFANVYFPDSINLVQISFQVLYFLTPVFYPPDLMQGRFIGRIMEYNPLGHFVRLIREPILDGRMPALDSILLSSLTVLAVVGAATWLLYRNERTLIYHL